MSGEEFSRKKHTLFISNREEAQLEGVTDVDSFNEEEIRALTDYGELIIKGSSLQVEALDLETGVLNVKGNIAALVYTDRKQTKGKLGRLFS